ncbi:Kinesin-like protein kif9 [Cichlidogyrus casuarinus]|uniref:Kinesin-like protein kif9 n=1 Tax=Cichlidogyrus casuarinus TaxID=1844966 RepID=A0ABD2Q2Y2_9PLAT
MAQLEKEKNQLLKELAVQDILTNRGHVDYSVLTETQVQEIRASVLRYLSGESMSIDVINARQIQGTFDSFKQVYRLLEQRSEELNREIRELRESVLQKDQQIQVLNASLTAAKEVSVAPAVEQTVDAKLMAALPNSKAKSKKGTSKQTTTGSTEVNEGVGELSPLNQGFSSNSISAPQVNENSPIIKKRAQEMLIASDREEDDIKAENFSLKIPSRSSAFENFKQSQGSEIWNVCQTNQQFLRVKVEAKGKLIEELNAIKDEISGGRKEYEQLKAERESLGMTRTTEGLPIVDEREASLVEILNSLQSSYRVKKFNLDKLDTVVRFCARMTQLAKERLFLEFDKWYSTNFATELTQLAKPTAELTLEQLHLGEEIVRRGLVPQPVPIRPPLAERITTKLDRKDLFQMKQQSLERNNYALEVFTSVNAKQKLLNKRLALSSIH